MARAKVCTWTGTAARGVYKPSCSITGILGVPPAPGAECPYCERPVAFPAKKGKTPTIADYKRWKERQKFPAPTGVKPDG
jgi:hypothetical protein